MGGDCRSPLARQERDRARCLRRLLEPASENDAINVALNSCRNQGGQGCKIIGSTFTGCGYVAIGNTKTSVRYGTGESPAAALDQCRKGGFTCGNPVGGCGN